MQVTRLISLLSASALVLGSALAQGQLDPAARLLLTASQPAASPQPSFRAAQPSTIQQPLVSVYVQCDAQQTDWQALTDLDAQVGLCVAGFATVTLPASQLSALSAVPGIRYVQASRSAQLMLDEVRADVRADLAHQYHPASDQTSSYTGQGIIIGQVDAGLDYTHRAFRNADGTLRISRVWEQGTNAATAPIPGLHAPEGFGYGAEFDTPELILRAGADSEYGTHGTHVMGIAAGSDPYLDGLYQGIAPDAELVMVAISDVGPDNVRISDAIKYIFDYADQQHKPCVINLSLGSHSGPHDGTSPFDQIADALQGPGRLIVGASGNYGGDLFHISRDVQQQPDTLQFYLCHAFYSSYTYGDVEFWADSLLQLRFEMLDHSTYTGAADVVASFTWAELMDGQVHSYTLGRNITGSIQTTAEVNPLNGKLHLLMRSFITGQRNNHQVAMRVVSTQGTGQLDVWADDAKITLATRDKNGVITLPDGYFNPDGQSTITEIGGTAHRILSVGAYTTRDHFTIEGSSEVFEVNYPVQNYPVVWAVPLVNDERCIFSGFGPTADGRPKPELCAPGSFIVSAMSGYDLSSQYLAAHYTDASGHPVRYGYLQGTSFSCPVVTGAVALWLQACPTLTPEQLKQVVATTSRTDALTLADERRWGAGRLDVLAGLQLCEQLQPDDAIQTVRPDASTASDRAVFDLFGRPLAPDAKGLQLRGKKKIIITK